MTKRALDLVLIALLVPMVLPIGAATALAVRLSMGSPVLFGQTRSGRGGAPFRMYKFRSMRAEAYPDEPDTVRLTRTGRFIRRASLDELPGLWNVMRGEMSFVGPRPLLPRYLDWYTEHERRRFEVAPGITGLAQISGRNYVGWDRKLALDVEYVERADVRTDLAILMRTVTKVLTAADVAPDNTAVEEYLDVVRRRERGTPA